MEKLKLKSKEVTKANIERISEFLPGCIVEIIGKDGHPSKAVDFELLKQELADQLIEGSQERYQLNWPGKKAALFAANAPIAKTLRPCEAESVDFNKTKNLFIEGDNLDALKLLQETYLGKIKLIYIDPPYNTGKDFIYKDDYSLDSQSYLLQSNQKSEIGERLISNLESNGRFHSDWLSMMYPRLKLASNLLSDDGAIVVSIGDEEVHNLICLMNEVFGEENHSANFCIIRSEGGGLAKQVIKGHDYLLVYAKNIEKFIPFRRPRDVRGEIVDVDGVASWIEEDWLRKEFGKYGTCEYGEIEKYHGIDKKNEIEEGLRKGIYRLITKKDGRIFVGRLRNLELDSSKFHSVQKHLNANASDDLSGIGMENLFDFPKPVSLIKDLVLGGTFFSKNKEEIILDFFAGSSTTAHAVMARNAEDGGNRRFIMVQIPAEIAPGTDAAKRGYKTISELSKERVRKAGRHLMIASQEAKLNLDVGFRVLKVDESNLAEVFYKPDDVSQDLLFDQRDNVRSDRTAEDLLFQVLLDWGVDLSLPISKETIHGKEILSVDKDALLACFDNHGGITEDLVKELAKRQPLRVVFRDAGFASDSIKINIEQIFKLISPSTEVKCI